MRTILITGGAGFIGRNLVEKVLSTDNRPRLVIVDHCRDVNGEECKVRRQVMAEWGEMLAVDVFYSIKEAKQCIREARPYAAVLLAALPNVRVGNEDPDRCRKNNVGVLQDTLPLLTKDCVVVFSSSSTVYGDCGFPWHEDAVPHPVCTYARSKLRCEELLIRAEFDTCYILRLFSVHGKYGRGDMFPALLMKAILHSDTFEYHDGDAKLRDFTWVGDVVSFCGTLLGRKKVSEGTVVLNVGGGEPHTLAFVQSQVELIAEERLRTHKPLAPTRIDGNVEKTEASIKRAEEYGFCNTPDALRKGLEDQWQSLKADYPMRITELTAECADGRLKELRQACNEFGTTWHSVRESRGADPVPFRTAIANAMKTTNDAAAGNEVSKDEARDELVLPVLRGSKTQDWATAVLCRGDRFIPHRVKADVRAVLSRKVVVVIATVPSRGGLLQRAVASVDAQTASAQIAEVVVVVDDGDAALLPSKGKTTYLRNKRTKGVSGTGAWNTGIDHIHNSRGGDVWVAVLDDDDEWEASHIEANLVAAFEAADPSKVEMCVSGLLRVTPGNETKEETIPAAFPALSELLVTNPGIQGSNLFVRCSALIEAGMFDEALPAGTDRDLCIRLRELFETDPKRSLETAYASAKVHTVRHYADEDRDRVSNRGPKKNAGLCKFFYKHASKMGEEEQARYFERAKHVFGCPPETVRKYCDTQVCDRLGVPSICTEQPPVLMGAATASVMEILLPAADGPALSERARVIVGIISSSVARLMPLLRDLDRYAFNNTSDLEVGLLVLFNDKDGSPLQNKLAGWEHSFSSAEVFTPESEKAERVLSQLGPRTAAERLPIAQSRTVLQTELYSIAVRQSTDAVVVLDDDKRLPSGWCLKAALASGKVLLGRDIKTAPNTVFMSCRTQLLDLISTLEYDRSSAPVPALPLSDAGSDDCYYDLSSRRFDHLEMPRHFCVGGADVAQLVERVLKGDPLSRDAVPNAEDDGTETTQRGGCLLVPKSHFKVLLTPQHSPTVGTSSGAAALRRSDSYWCKYLRQQFEVKFHVCSGLSVIHDNATDEVSTPSKLRENALLETLGSALCAAADNKTLSVKEHVEERAKRLHRSLLRVRTLVRKLRSLLKDSGRSEECVRSLEEAVAHDCWEAEVFAQMQAFADDDPQSVLDELFARRTATLCGAGKEGCLYREGEWAVKVFHRTDPSLLDLVDSASPVFEGLRVDRTFPPVVRMKFINGEEYKGGHGRALVRLMRKWRQHGLVHSNFKRENVLQVHDEGGVVLHIVDFGRDVAAYTHEGFESMLHRAFLTFRFRKYSVHELAVTCRTPEEAEMSFFDNFRSAVLDDPPAAPSEDVFEDLAAVREALCGTNAPSRILLRNPLIEEQSRILFEMTRLLSKHGLIAKSAPTDEFGFDYNDRLEPLEQFYEWQLAPGNGLSIALVVKCCPHDAHTIVGQTRQLVGQLRAFGTFVEVVLLADLCPPPKGTFLRSHVTADFDTLKDELLAQLVVIEESQIVDRVVRFGAEEVEAVKETNRVWFGQSSASTHSEGGQSYIGLLNFLRLTHAKIVCQADCDVIVNRNGRDRTQFSINDIVARYFQEHPSGVTLEGLPTCNYNAPLGQRCRTPPFEHVEEDDNGQKKKFRFEVRFSYVHVERLRAMLPFQAGFAPQLSGKWYRIFDAALRGELLSSRFALFPDGVEIRLPFFTHPPNELKGDDVAFQRMADRVANSIPRAEGNGWCGQTCHVGPDIKGDVTAWHGERCEPIVVVICGCRVGHARAKRCLDSLAQDLKKGSGAGLPAVGVVVADDGSPDWAAVDERRCHAARLFEERLTFVTHPQNVGYMGNLIHCVSDVCGSAESVIMTLDLDDFLVACDSESVVLKAWKQAFADGRFDVALGGMVRPDKPRDTKYTLNTHNPRYDSGAAGNVWQHCRCFRKSLFDAIRKEDFTSRTGELFTSIGADWSYMVPIVEQAGPDRVLELDFATYFFDPSTRVEEKLSILDDVRADLQTRCRYPMAGTRLPSCLLLGEEWTFVVYPEGAIATCVGGGDGDEVLEVELDTAFSRREAVQDWVFDRRPHVKKLVVTLPHRGRRLDVRTTLGIDVEKVAALPSEPERRYRELRSPTDEKVSYHILANAAFEQRRTQVRVRIHSECVTGDVFGSMKCDCGEQLSAFLKEMDAERHPQLLVYITGHEGRSNGLHNKIRAYGVLDTHPDRNHEEVLKGLGCVSEKRCFAELPNLLKGEYGFVTEVTLLTNNANKLAAFQREFSTTSEAMESVPNRHNLQYLKEKKASLTLGLQQTVVSDSLKKVPKVFESIGFTPSSHAACSVEQLSELMRCVLRSVPYHNSPVGGGTNLSSLLSLKGGRCATMNGLLLVLLRHLGYDAFCAQGTTEQGRDDHGFLLVNIDHKLYWVDVGNSRPYPPVELTSGAEVPASPLYEGISVVEEGCSSYKVQHRRSGDASPHTNYTFCSRPQPDSAFVQIAQNADRSDPGSDSFRFSLWGDDTGITINGEKKNGMNCTLHTRTGTSFAAFDEVKDAVRQHVPELLPAMQQLDDIAAQGTQRTCRA